MMDQNPEATVAGHDHPAAPWLLTGWIDQTKPCVFPRISSSRYYIVKAVSAHWFDEA
jgi:hypothetical protein